MRRLARLAATAGAILLGTWALTQYRPVPVQAQVKQPVPAPPAVPGAPPAPRTDNGLFSIPEQRDAREQLKAVLDYLERTNNVPWDVIARTAQRLLDAKSDSFYRLKDAKGNETGAVVSVKSKVNAILAGLPKDGRQFYEQEYGAVAAGLLKQAVDAGYDRVQLADVSQRYFQTKAGAQAAVLLAGLALEAGDHAEAAYHFARLLDRPDTADTLSPRLLLKAALAFKRAGDPRQAETAAKLADRLEKAFPRDGLVVGRRAYSLDEVKQELARAAVAPGTDSLTLMRLGNVSHTGLSVGGTPFLDAAFSKPMIYHRSTPASTQGADWLQQNLELTFKTTDPMKKSVPLPGFFPVTAPNRVLYRGYDGVYALATKDWTDPLGRPRAAGDVVWFSKAKGAVQSMASEARPGQASPWANYWRQTSPTILFDNAAAGSLSHDGNCAYYVDDLAIPPAPAQQMNQFGGQFGGMPPGVGAGGSTNEVAARDSNSLRAINLATGRNDWHLGGMELPPMSEAEEAKSTDAYRLTQESLFLGPPVSVNGKLYVLYERRGSVKLACLDPTRVTYTAGQVSPSGDRLGVGYSAPDLVWVQNLGEATTPLRVDSVRRTQPAYLAYADGVMVCPTGCGVVVAVDINARSLLWARYYGAAPDLRNQPGTPGFGGGMPIRRRPVGWDGSEQQPLPTDRWRAAAPIIVGNKVVVAAHDSELIQCLDLRTGQQVWSAARQPDDLYLGGVFGGKLLVVGKKSARAYTVDAEAGKENKPAWDRLAIGTPTGHGVANQDGLYYLPVLGDPQQQSVVDPQVWAIDIPTGQVRSRTAFKRKPEAGPTARFALGNLAFHEGLLVSQSPTEVAAFPLLELKRQEMTARLKLSPTDPEGLTARGELLLDDGQLREAVADFKLAQANKPSPGTERKIRQKLYTAYTELLRNKFEDGEPFLAEYESLCAVDTEVDDPTEKLRRLNEQLRRRGLYLALLAKGREKQGRLVEAFEAYRAFATLGGNRELVAIFDEPNGATRPDVWARGRIDAMIRTAAADSPARAALVGRVRADWAGLKSANDLPRLREFVSVFSPFFPEGLEAQLLLADRLAATGNDADSREAQSLLMSLSGTADDPIVAGRAVEGLARLLIRRNMLEDAVAYYAQLGRAYADVPIRDGKTGADIYGDLVADKRLLPYLEPPRGPLAARPRFEVIPNNPPRQVPPAFSLRVDGDPLPFFNRFHYGLEVNPADNTWTLKVTDRVSGEERCKFPGLPAQAVMNTGGASVSSLRLATAGGQYLVLSLGQFVYCFDLAEKREWRISVLGNNTPPEQVQPRADADGELTFNYTDGFSLKLGRSVVVHPSYICVLTRDGLKCYDPATSQELWVRTNVSHTAQVFGDAKNVYLIETSGSRVLRALDGAPVEAAKNFATAPAGTTRLGTYGGRFLTTTQTETGRELRLADAATDKEVWRKPLPGKWQTLKTIDPQVVACLRIDGHFEALDVATGKTLASGTVDADRLAADVLDGPGPGAGFGVTNALLLLDAERAFLVLNRGVENNRVRAYQPANLLRSAQVNGPIYAFDRATGKRLWYNSDVLLTQRLVLERFEDLPVLVAATGQVDANNLQQFRIVALDKRTGLLRYNLAHPPQQGDLTAVALDPTTRAVEMYRQDLRIRVTPDDAPPAK